MQRETRRTNTRLRVRWLVAALLLVPIIFPLLVGTYDKSEPEFLGFPFYYWYQFLWILIGAVITAIAYFLLDWEKRRTDMNRRSPGDGTP